MFYKVLNTLCFGNLLSLLLNRILSVQIIIQNSKNLFKKSEVAPKRKALSIVVNSSTLDSLEFLDLSLLNCVATTLY